MLINLREASTPKRNKMTSPSENGSVSREITKRLISLAEPQLGVGVTR
ncbi:hypothetical protein [Bacillus sp. C1]